MKLLTGLIMCALMAGIIGYPSMPVRKAHKVKIQKPYEKILKKIGVLIEAVYELSDKIDPNTQKTDDRPALETILNVNTDSSNTDMAEGDEKPDPAPPQKDNGGKRNAIASEDRRVPAGVVNYKIGDEFSESNKRLIRSAMSEIESVDNTCIRFNELSGEFDIPESGFLHITGNSGGCWSYVGWWTSYFPNKCQPLNLMISQDGLTCMDKPIILHELLHAIGMYHEHVRKDRDEYVDINFENIKSGHLKDFDKKSNALLFNLPYDFHSIMQYSRNAFAKSGTETMTAKVHVHDKLGGRDLSELDKKKLAALYATTCKSASE